MIGEKLKEIRTRNGWTRRQIADAAGINANHLYMLEAGMRFPKLDTFCRLVGAMKVTNKELIKIIREEV